MKLNVPIEQKIFNREQLERKLANWRKSGNKIVFTNGVFDIVHKGHLTLLSKCAQFGDILIIGMNSDDSVKRLKGPDRPINDQDSRALLLAALAMTDGVILFDADTPIDLIQMIQPDVLVKGGDYTTDTIVGADLVIKKGGEVMVVALEDGFSTTATIQRIVKTKNAGNA